jgi:hypothetical protein
MTIEKAQIKKSSGLIPDGIPKSGRSWKVKQTSRFSTQNRQGVLSHLSKTYEERKAMKEQFDSVKSLEQRMKDDKLQKKTEEKQRREERKKQRMANEFKNSQYQVIKADKIKHMSKKQLRMIKKTAMNKNGQVELVNPWTNKA